MKKIILSTLIILSVVSFSIAQICQLKVGMKFTFETSMYPSLVERDGVEFIKLSQKAKDKKVAPDLS